MDNHKRMKFCRFEGARERTKIMSIERIVSAAILLILCSVALYFYVANHLYQSGGSLNNYSSTLAQLKQHLAIASAEAKKLESLLDAGNISEEKCKKNLTSHFDGIIEAGSLDSDTWAYLNQSILNQRVVCLKISCERALESIGNEYKERMETLGENISQKDDAIKSIAECIREISGNICTTYDVENYETIFNKTIGKMASTIKRHFEPILEEARQLESQIELNLRLNAKLIKWLLFYAPKATDMADSYNFVKNATLHKIVEDCGGQSRLVTYSEAIYGEDAANIQALMRNIKYYCATNNGLLDFKDLVKLDLIRSLLGFLKQVTNLKTYESFFDKSGKSIFRQSQGLKNFNRAFRSATFDLCARVRPRITPYLKANGTKELPNGLLKDQVDDVRRLCIIIEKDFNDITSKSEQILNIENNYYVE